MFCIKCGEEIIKDSKFCANCGEPTMGSVGSPEEKVKLIKKERRFSLKMRLIVFGLIAFLLPAFTFVIIDPTKSASNQSGANTIGIIGGFSLLLFLITLIQIILSWIIKLFKKLF